MFQWAANFYRRHRRKLLISGLVLSGAYAAARYAKYRLELWQDEHVKQYAQQARKQQHFERNEEACRAAFLSHLPTLRNTIAQRLDTESLLAALKLRPDNKLEVWAQLKVLSFARAMCSVLALALCRVYLTAQMNVLAGRMFRDTTANEGMDEERTDVMDVGCAGPEERYMNSIRYLLQEGIAQLIDDTVKAVSDAIGALALTEKISYERLQGIWEQVLEVLAEEERIDGASVTRSDGASATRSDGASATQSSSVKHAFCKYVIDPDYCALDSDASNTDGKYATLMSELHEVLTGSDCSTVLKQCTHDLSCRMFQELMCHFERGANEAADAIVSVADEESATQCSAALPLAKLVPLMNAQLHGVFAAEGENEYLRDLLDRELIGFFAENIYQGFSSS